MAVVLDRFSIDGNVYDVLEDCDQLSLGLARLRRQGRISEQDWRNSTEHLDEIRARIEAHRISARPIDGVGAGRDRPPAAVVSPPSAV